MIYLVQMNHFEVEVRFRGPRENADPSNERVYSPMNTSVAWMVFGHTFSKRRRQAATEAGHSQLPCPLQEPRSHFKLVRPRATARPLSTQGVRRHIDETSVPNSPPVEEANKRPTLVLQSYLLLRYLDPVNPPQFHLLRRYNWSPRALGTVILWPHDGSLPQKRKRTTNRRRTVTICISF